MEWILFEYYADEEHPLSQKRLTICVTHSSFECTLLSIGYHALVLGVLFHWNRASDMCQATCVAQSGMDWIICFLIFEASHVVQVLNHSSSENVELQSCLEHSLPLEHVDRSWSWLSVLQTALHEYVHHVLPALHRSEELDLDLRVNVIVFHIPNKMMTSSLLHVF